MKFRKLFENNTFKELYSNSQILNENLERQLISKKVKEYYEVRKENVKLFADGKFTEIESCYSPKGKYLGDEKTLKYLINKKGITEFDVAESSDNVCSIGFNPKENKWYGWSHRAISGFGIGDKIFEENFGNDKTLFTQHGKVTIKNLDQAKQSAINFANYVS
jgi:hypothetical protein